MTKICSSLHRVIRLSAIVSLAAIVLNPSGAFAQAPSLGAAGSFTVLAGGPAVAAVTCTGPGFIMGNVGNVSPGTFVSSLGCTVAGTFDPNVPLAYAAFRSAYTALQTAPPACVNQAGTLAGVTLFPGVYCVDGVEKAGVLTLNGNGNPNAVWLFLVEDGTGVAALTGTSFHVLMINGGQPCNVYWWVEAAATMTASNLMGTILAGADITFTDGTLHGRALAGGAGVNPSGAVTLTRSPVTGGCKAKGGGGGVGDGDKCEGKDRDDDDKDGDHHDKDGDHHDKDKDKDHKDKDREGQDKKRG